MLKKDSELGMKQSSGSFNVIEHIEDEDVILLSDDRASKENLEYLIVLDQPLIVNESKTNDEIQKALKN